MKIVQPGSFDSEQHRYPQVLNAKAHPLIEYFFSLTPERIAARYCHLHPFVDQEDILKRLRYKTKHFHLAGSDLMNVTTGDGKRKMVVIENNSCPSGQKSMPLLSGEGRQGGYRRFVEECLGPRIAKTKKEDGVLALLYDKNQMENTGHAAAMADHFREEVYFVEYKDADQKNIKREDGWLFIKDEKSERQKVRACFRYVTQKPWNRIPLITKTLVINPIISCMAGGRNKLVAAKAYMKYNNRIRPLGMSIQIPQTVVDITKDKIPFWLDKFDGRAVVKIPYSNAGQGVYTIVNQSELDAFMKEEHFYDRFIVQALIGNRRRSSHSFDGKLYHVGMIPDKENNTYVADVRMRIMNTPSGFKPLSLNARRAAAPLASRVAEGTDSRAMLGTNLSKKGVDGKRGSESDRLVVVDEHHFNDLGLSLDDLIEGYIQSVLTTIAIDRVASLLITKEKIFNKRRFMRYNNDQQLLDECCRL